MIDHLEFDDGTTLTYNQLLALGFDLTGTPEADTLTGTAADDRIRALESDDVIYAKAERRGRFKCMFGRDRNAMRATLGKGLSVSAFPLVVPV